MPEPGLWEALQPVIPDESVPIVEASIRALSNLPAMSTWKPDRLTWGKAMDVMTWGFPLVFLSAYPSLDRLRSAYGASIIEQGRPDPCTSAEIAAAGLVAAVGANDLEYVKTGKERTPDFRVRWENAVIELEVTKASQKPAHVRCAEMAETLGGELLNLCRAWDIVVHVVDKLTEAEIGMILAAGKNITPAGPADDKPGHWRVYAETVDRPADQFLRGGQSGPVPAWWPAGAVTQCCVGSRIGGPETSGARGQVRVNYAVPVTSYINPVEKKVDHFQGSGDTPYVIALEVAKMPGAFREFRRELPAYFQEWPRISAVLVFVGPYFGYVEVGWIWEIRVNPRARYPLPTAMLRCLPANPSIQRTYMNLSSSSPEQEPAVSAQSIMSPPS